MEEVIPRFSRINNRVLFDHYGKKLGEELDLSEDTVFSMLKYKGTQGELRDDFKKTDEEEFSAQKTPEAYLLALLLQLPLDTMKDTAEKVDETHFLDENLREIFRSLREFLQEVSEFNVNEFMDGLDENYREVISDLYLRDVDHFSDNNKLLTKEIESVLSRMKRRKVKQDLEELSGKIKLAEMENNTELVEKLTNQFNEISKDLI
jgi:hypothetical protein